MKIWPLNVPTVQREHIPKHLDLLLVRNVRLGHTNLQLARVLVSSAKMVSGLQAQEQKNQANAQVNTVLLVMFALKGLNHLVRQENIVLLEVRRIVQQEHIKIS